jgi:hypothetical protein
VYTTLAGTHGIPDTTIASTPYNLNVDDVATDLNAPRPIIAGGTGANSAFDARVNLLAERANQVVTNFDSHVWEFGSFSSAAGATAAPTANEFAGIVYGVDLNNLVVEARDRLTGILYLRRKVDTAWVGTPPFWTIDGDQYVSVSGDTMTGDLVISRAGASSALHIDKVSGAAGFSNLLLGKRQGLNRWLMELGDGGVESGGHVGSDFRLHAYDDSGSTPLTTPIIIPRSTGAVAIRGSGTNDSAFAQYVGEHISALLDIGAETALASAAAKTVVSISLSPGDWDVTASIGFVAGATTNVLRHQASLSTVNNTLNLSLGRWASRAFGSGQVPGNNARDTLTIPPYRFSLSAPTFIHLVAEAVFADSTYSVAGYLRARRVR